MKKGIDAKIQVSISEVLTAVAGFATWSYSGEVRDLLTQVEFGVEYRQQEASIYEGGEVELTGFYKADSDAGQQQLRAWFLAATQITHDLLKLFVDDTVYLTPDDTTTPPSYFIITKYNDTAQDVAGVCTFNMTLKVSGRLLEVQ